jgi:molecular chaperone GrpE
VSDVRTDSGDDPPVGANGGDQHHQAEAQPATAPPTEGGASPDALGDDLAAAVMSDLDLLAAERDDYYDQLLRTRADFDNFRKRMIKQQTEHLERANEGLIVKLLEVLDVLDGAQAHGEGFEQVGARLVGVLAKEGLERVDPMGRAFDPNEADAVAHEPAPPGQPDGAQVVSAVLRPGYRWKGRVVRPAMVKVTG